MASNTDAAFVEDVEVEQELRVRTNGFKRSSKSGARSPGFDNDNEDAPLLGSLRDNSGEEEWAGDADFRGLPWWKRPSVGA
jgi:hypothetical protein